MLKLELLQYHITGILEWCNSATLQYWIKVRGIPCNEPPLKTIDQWQKKKWQLEEKQGGTNYICNAMHDPLRPE